MSCKLCGGTFVVKRFKSAGYDHPPTPQDVSCPECCADEDEPPRDEAKLTLWLARRGISPEDARRGAVKKRSR